MGSLILTFLVATSGPRVYVGGPDALTAPVLEALAADGSVALVDAAPCVDLACVNSRVSTFGADLGVLLRNEASGPRVVVVDSTGNTVRTQVVGPEAQLVDVVRQAIGLVPEPSAAPGADAAPRDPAEEPEPEFAPTPVPQAPVREPDAAIGGPRPRPEPKPAPAPEPKPEPDKGCGTGGIIAGVVGGACLLATGACVFVNALDPSGCADGCADGCSPDLNCNPDLNCGSSCASLPLQGGTLPELRPTPRASEATSMAF
jgi:hypothetical protein